MLNPVHHVRFWVAFAKLSRDPSSLGSVFQMSRALMKLASDEDRRAVVVDFRRSIMGQEALLARPRLGRIDMDRLRELDVTTLGGAYARFMTARGHDPNSIPRLDPDNTGDEFEFVIAHFYETHDLWHIVTGMDTDVPGELGLQALFFFQYPSPLATFLLAAGLLGAATKSVKERQGLERETGASGVREILSKVSEGVQMGRGAQRLVGRDWRRDWEKPLMWVRKDVGAVRTGFSHDSP